MRASLASLPFLLGTIACGSSSAGPDGGGGTPEDCGLGVVADTAKFDRMFNSMKLVVAGTNAVPPAGVDASAQYAAAETVGVQADAKSVTIVRACVVQNTTGGKIQLDRMMTFASGMSTFTLDDFPIGTYVVRVGVDDVLVKNLTFEVK